MGCPPLNLLSSGYGAANGGLYSCNQFAQREAHSYSFSDGFFAPSAGKVQILEEGEQSMEKCGSKEEKRNESERVNSFFKLGGCKRARASAETADRGPEFDLKHSKSIL